VCCSLESYRKITKCGIEELFDEGRGQGVEGGSGGNRVNELKHEEQVARICAVVKGVGGGIGPREGGGGGATSLSID
jgi:hypothetical protein